MEGPIVKSTENQEVKAKSTPKIWAKGPIKIFNVELDSYILRDGTALLRKSKMMKALGRPWRGKSRSESPTFIGAQNLQPFIRPELKEELKGIELLDGSKLVSCYHADILPLVCNVYLEARAARALTRKQLPIAETCEMLIRSFARIGIVALIYEQLGFERLKHPNALRLLIESYLAEEIRRWSKEFPDEFFFQLDRIYGHEKTTSRNRPKYYARFIRKYIYDPIERGLVLEELDERNPLNERGVRRQRHHQLLNEKKGLPVLRSDLAGDCTFKDYRREKTIRKFLCSISGTKLATGFV